MSVLLCLHHTRDLFPARCDSRDESEQPGLAPSCRVLRPAELCPRHQVLMQGGKHLKAAGPFFFFFPANWLFFTLLAHAQSQPWSCVWCKRRCAAKTTREVTDTRLLYRHGQSRQLASSFSKKKKKTSSEITQKAAPSSRETSCGREHRRVKIRP